MGAGANCSKAAVFLAGGGGGTWEPAKPVLAGELERQGSSAVSAALCYRVLTGTRARIWVKSSVRIKMYNSNSDSFLFPQLSCWNWDLNIVQKFGI